MASVYVWQPDYATRCFDDGEQCYDMWMEQDYILLNRVLNDYIYIDSRNEKLQLPIRYKLYTDLNYIWNGIHYIDPRSRCDSFRTIFDNDIFDEMDHLYEPLKYKSLYNDIKFN